MKILFIQCPAAIRAVKEMAALRDRGHIVMILTEERSFVAKADFDDNRLPYCFGRFDVEGFLQDAPPVCQQFDVVHVLNEPNWHVGMLRLALGSGFPIVWDCQDISTSRHGGNDYDEEHSVNNCSALVSTAPGMLQYLQEKYHYAGISGWVPNAPSRSMLPKLLKPKLPGLHLVYEGCILPLSEEMMPQIKPYYFIRDYFEPLSQCVYQGISVHCYGYHDIMKDDRYVQLAKTGRFFYHGRLSFRDLISEMSMYTAGWAGVMIQRTNECHRNIMRVVSMNKTYDYPVAGIPAIEFGCWNDADFVVEQNAGYRLDCWDQLPGRVRDSLDFDVQKVNKEVFLMEHYIWRLEGIYRQVVS